MSEARTDPTTLVAALRDGDVPTRWRAALELGRVRGPIARAGLLEALTADASARVREEAARALGEHGARRPIPVLIGALRDDPGAHVREAAAEALGRIGDVRAVDALAAALDDPHPTVRRQAGEALEAVGAWGRLRIGSEASPRSVGDIDGPLPQAP